MNRTIKYFFATALLLLSLQNSQVIAQQSTLPFKPGEALKYDLYFKYGLVNAKAGSSSLSMSEEVYNGENMLKARLLAKSSGAVKNFFPVADTLTAWLTREIHPVRFLKNAHEGKDHSIEEVRYQYYPSYIKAHVTRVRNDIPRYDTTLIASRPVYDMLSILYYVRTLDFNHLTKGNTISVPYLSGRKVGNMEIVYRGTDNIKANNGRKYSCLKLVMLLNDDAFEDKNEAMRVYISNDDARIPVRIDSKLKTGSTRVILNSVSYP